jgi:hypothetical protein
MKIYFYTYRMFPKSDVTVIVLSGSHTEPGKFEMPWTGNASSRRYSRMEVSLGPIHRQQSVFTIAPS